MASYRCCILLSPEDGGFCVRAADLAGVVSKGETIDEALAKDTYAGAIESYRTHGDPIPWLVPPKEPKGNEQRLVIQLGG